MSDCAPLTEALALGERLLALARAGQWDKACVLEPELVDKLETAFADPVPSDQQAWCRQLGDHLQAVLAELETLASAERDTIAKAISGLRRGRKAAESYNIEQDK